MQQEVNFIKEKDNKSLLMIVNKKIVMENIPYIPEKCVDHRGVSIYIFFKQNNLNIENLKLSSNVENVNEVWRGYNYMKNPIFVKQAISNFKNRI